MAERVEVPGAVWAAALLFLFVLGPLALIGIRQTWRDAPHLREPPGGLSDRQWQTYSRSAPAALLTLTSAFSFLPVFALFDIGSLAFSFPLLILLALCAIGSVLAATTALVVWPKWLIPPPRRGDRGLLTPTRSPGGASRGRSRRRGGRPRA